MAVLLLTSDEARPSAAQSAAPAAQVLQRAREWLGGQKLLDNVRSLEIQRGAQTIRLLFPDRYQTEQAASSGGIKVGFTGSTLWMQTPGAPPQITGATAAHKARGLRRMAMYALTYLVRLSPSQPLTPRVRAGACGPVDGLCVEFASRDARPIHMLFSADDGRPLALLYYGSLAADAEPSFQSITLLSDYRVIEGIRFPFSETIKRRNLADGSVTELSSWRYASVRINPPFSPSMFDLPAK